MTMQRMRSILAPLASLRLTVVLLAMSIVLILAGTLAQTEQDIWNVMHTYFRSAFVYIPLRLFVPRDVNMPVEIPFPGGFTIGGLMLANLLAAHAVRFRMRAMGGRLALGLSLIIAGAGLIAWFHVGPLPATVLGHSGGYAGVLPLMLLGAVFYAPVVAGCAIVFGRRGGIVQIHAALILLLVGEFVTAATAVETQMPIYEGASSNWAQDIREVELSIVDPSSPNFDFTVAIPEARLIEASRTGEPIIDADLPFQVFVDRYYSNSAIRTMSNATAGRALADRGFGITATAERMPEVSGVDSSKAINVPAAYVTFMKAGVSFGTYMVSPNLQFDSHVIAEQELRTDTQVYRIALRFRRHYKPYALHLKKFHHDVYPGTNVPRDFSSELRLVDPEHVTEQDVVVFMNNPLRYAGETFFQTSWIPGVRPGDPDRGTILMVVRNPGWTIPYIACAIGTIGLVFHFGLTLVRFLKRSAA